MKLPEYLIKRYTTIFFLLGLAMIIDIGIIIHHLIPDKDSFTVEILLNMVPSFTLGSLTVILYFLAISALIRFKIIRRRLHLGLTWVAIILITLVGLVIKANLLTPNFSVIFCECIFIAFYTMRSQEPKNFLIKNYSIKNLRKNFKFEKIKLEILKDINFHIESGQWVALTGKSGCGKTTLLNLLGGLDKPTSGEIWVTISNQKKAINLAKLDSKEMAKLRGENIGFVFQAFNLFPELNALENIALPLLVDGVGRRKAIELAKVAIKTVNLEDRSTHHPSQMSGGEQQRIAIARALIRNPNIILADEPTGNLDDENAEDIMKIFEKLHKVDGKTIIMVTHCANLAGRADVKIKMHDGICEEVKVNRVVETV